LIHTYVQMIR